MRTISADNNAILLGGARTVAHRLSVKDSGGTFRDLTTYPGVDLVSEIRWSEDLESPGVTWDATLIREQESLSLAPLLQASPLNRGFNPATAYAALLQVGREMKVEYSLLAEDDPRARSWALAFSGYIDSIDSGGNGVVQIGGRGLEAPIVNAYIQRERVYAYAQGANADRGCYIWPDPTTGATYTTFAVGDRVIPTDSKTNGHYYRATSVTTGITGSTEPTWPTGGGATVVDGGVTWTESGSTSTSIGTAVETVMQQILNDNGLSAVTLWCPVSPTWLVQWFLVARQSVFDELKALADQIGWCLRYVDDAGTPKLKLFDPNRTTTTSLRSFGPSQVQAPYGRLSSEWKDIRNHIRVVYSDSQDLDPAGNPKRKAVQYTTPASITKYGELFAEIAEAHNSNIDTASEAAVLANAVLSDLAEPEAEIEATLIGFFPFCEVCDLYTLSADGVCFDSDQKLATVGYSHQVGERQTTTIRLRGKPASNSKSGWFERLSDAAGAEQHDLTTKQNASPISLITDALSLGGARIDFDWAGPRNPKDNQFELHISKTTGFTPSSSTLVATGSERSFEVGNLIPGTEHYAKVVPVTYNGRKPVRGSPSEQVSFFPGRGAATHLNPNVLWGKLPLNGGFETQTDPLAPPDFWLVGGGAWGTEVNLGTSGGLGGAHYVTIEDLGTSGPGVASAEFTVNELSSYIASMWRKAVSGAGTAEFGFFWYDITHNIISSDSGTIDLTTNVGSWVQATTAAVTPPAGTRFATLFVFLDGSGVGEIHVDSMELINRDLVEAPPQASALVTRLGADFGTFGSIEPNGIRTWSVVAKSDANSNAFTTWLTGVPNETNAGAQTPTVLNPRAWNLYTTGVALNSFGGLKQGSGFAACAWVQRPRLRALVQNSSFYAGTGRRIWGVALTNSNNMELVQADGTLRYIGVRYDSAVSANWYLCTADGTNASEIDTGIPATLDIDYHFDLDFRDSGELSLVINALPEVTKTTDLPSGITFGKMVSTVTLLAAGVGVGAAMLWHHWMLEKK